MAYNEFIYRTDVFAQVTDPDIAVQKPNHEVNHVQDYAVFYHGLIPSLSLDSIQLLVDGVITAFTAVDGGGDWEIRRVTPILTIVKKRIPGQFVIELKTIGMIEVPIGEAKIGESFIIG
jgi:hypothetical protein